MIGTSNWRLAIVSCCCANYPYSCLCSVHPSSSFSSKVFLRLHGGCCYRRPSTRYRNHALYTSYSNVCSVDNDSSFCSKDFFSSSGRALNMKTDLSPMSSLMGCWNFLAANTVKSAIHTPNRPSFAPSSIKPDRCPRRRMGITKVNIPASSFP